MTVWGSALHTDSGAIATSASYGDRGDGSSTWFQPVRIYGGGQVDLGAKLDAAVTDPTASASVIAALKGILTANRLSAVGMLKAEDAAHVTGDSGIMALGVRTDVLAALATTTGDYIPLITDVLGRLWVSGTQAEDAVHTSGDTGHFILGVQSLARTARSADGDYSPVAVGAAGEAFHVIVHEANAAWADTNISAMSATSGVIKASPGKLYRVTVTNDNAAARWIQFFNLTAVPADTAVPVISVKLGIGASMQLNFGESGRYFSTGICWSNSSTGPTKTIGAADTEIDVQFL